MKLELIRTLGTDSETLGELLIDGKHFGYTLEDPVRDSKIKSETCIPYGSYKVQVTYSPRFKRPLPLIFNHSSWNVIAANGDVWSGVRFHGGNHHKNTEGCVLVGKTQHIDKPNTFKHSSGKVKVNNWILTSLSNELTKLLDDGTTHEFTIRHAGRPKGYHNYRLMNPMIKDGNVVLIQEALNAALDIPGLAIKVDGWFGQKTDWAVRAFQQSQSLIPTGVVDKDILERLKITL